MVKRRGPPLSLEEGDADMSGASATKSRPTKRPRLSTSIARPKIQPDPPDGDNEENIADDSMNQDDVEMTAPSAPQTLLHEDQAMHLADEPIEEDEPLDTATISEDSEEQNFSGDSSDSNDFVSITRAQFEFAKEKFLIADAAEVLEVDAGKKFARMHRKTRMTRWDKPVNKRMRRTKTRGIQWGLRPLSDMQDIFDDLTGNAVKLGFLDVIKDLGGRQLNVATMCSGTDSPMLALQMISHALEREHKAALRVNHLFSAEIVPKKCAFIERNFHPPLIFSDLREVGYSKEGIATTAYGAKAKIPRNVDILIAGFPCVDFSGVNPHKKTLGDLGESGDVLLAMIHYAKRHRPAIIVLENVEHCQWELMKALWGNDEEFASKMLKKSQVKQWLIWDDSHRGYASEWCVVDTKHYYLPHTRRRGYMFLVCKDLIESESEEAVMTTWLDNLELLKRPTSVSILEFLLDDDDPRLEKSLLEMSTTRMIKAEVDWELCKNNYEAHRDILGLGHRRPLTHWVEGGVAIFPDHWLLGWCIIQVERLWETFDSNYLRQARRNKQDALCKLRVWEMSQNVYRDKDTAPMGITGCLTPTGNPFPPAIGRPIVGLETLALGGLPIQRLLLTRESPRELTDLAGNAMTTTVVAAATISAMIAGRSVLRKLFEHREPRPLLDSSSFNKQAVITMDNSYLQSYTTMRCAGTEDIPLEIVLDLAVRTARLCCCEGTRHITSEALKMCKDCSHLCCHKCSGTPAHNYQRLHSRSRPSPHIFEDTIKSILPMRIKLNGLNDSSLRSLDRRVKGNMQRSDWKIVKEMVLSIVRLELRFYTVKRSVGWTVIYDSMFGRLELTINKDGACWLLYGKVNANEAGNSTARKLLKEPIAQMMVRGADLLQGSWSIGMPATERFKVSIDGVGSLIPSWKNSIGLVDFDGEFASSVFQVTYNQHPKVPLDLNIARKYIALPECGTASNSLYRGIPVSSNERIVPFFFLDPDLFGKPKADRFVFAIDSSKLGVKERRKIICSLQSEWHPTNRNKRTLHCATIREWLACDLAIQAYEGYIPATYATPGRHIALDVFAQQSPGPPVAAPIAYTCTTSAITLLSVNVPLKRVEDAGLQGSERGNWRPIPPAKFTEAVRKVAWFAQRTEFNEEFAHQWRMLSVPNSVAICRSCAPKEPTTKWRRPNQNSAKIVPQEYGKEAASHERAIKARPSFFFIRHMIDENKCSRVELAINLATIAHRAIAKLGLPAKPLGFGLAWRFDPSYKCPTGFDFKRLKVVSVKTPGHIIYNFPNRQYTLRPEQMRSLSWMARQESPSAKKWREEEIEEAFLPSFGWRAEVRASKMVEVLGGIIADVVGFGKTVTTLALIDSQKAVTDQKAKLPCEDLLPSEDLISLEATLIVVPPTLVSQWAAEVKKFLGNTHVVLAIQSQTVLSATTIEKFTAASIIIVNIDLLKSDAYWGKVALFAALPDGPPLGGRPFDDWHDRACKYIRVNVFKLKSKSTKTEMSGFADYLREERDQAQRDPILLESVPTKRLRGANYVRWRQKQSELKGIDASVRKATEKPLNYGHISNADKWKSMKSPCLEMFRFTRTVFDEHTYIEDRLLKTLGSLNADRRWILSGTPPLTNFADVWKMGILIKARLGVQDDASGVITHEDVMVMRNERSESENFRAYATSYTPAWHEARHRHAQAFLDQFARQNFPEGLTLPREFIIWPTTMYPVERIVHKDLQNRLEMTNFKVLRVVAKAGKSGRTDRLNKVLSHSDSAAEALLQSTSYYREAENAYGAMLGERNYLIRKALRAIASGLRCIFWLQNRCESVIEIDEKETQESDARKTEEERLEEKKLEQSCMEEKMKTELKEERAKARRIAKLEKKVEMGKMSKAKMEFLVEEMGKKEGEETRKQERDLKRMKEKREKKIEGGEEDIEDEEEKTVDGGEDDDLLRPNELWFWTTIFKSLAPDEMFGYRALFKLLQAVERQQELDHEDSYFRDEISEEQLQKEDDALKKYEHDVKKTKKEAKKHKEVLILLDENPVDPRPFKIIDDKRKTPDKVVDFEEYNEYLHDTISELRKQISKYFLEVGSKRFIQNAHQLATWRGRPSRGSSVLGKLDGAKDSWCSRCGQSCSDQGALVFPRPCGHVLCQWCFRKMSLVKNPRCNECGRDEAETPMCYGQERGHHCDPTTLMISMTCGHLSCPSCLEKRKHHTDCVKASCEIKTSPQHMKSATEFIGQNNDVCRYGGKLDAVIGLIRAIDENDRVLVFVQFEVLLQRVSGAFTRSGISHEALNNNERAAVENRLEAFKQGKKKVLVLNSSQDTAAGANLVHANHVIFITPFNAKVSHAYHSSRTQCIGRALRHGQKKTVFVYDFLALHTFDVDAFEYRQSTKLVRKTSADSEDWEMVQRTSLTDEEKAQAWGSGYRYRFGDELMEDV